MTQYSRTNHPEQNPGATKIEGYDSLVELALDLRSSWNHAADSIWQQLDAVLWESTHNPWVILQTVGCERIERLLADPVVRGNVDSLVKARRESAAAPAWFQRHHANSSLTCVAYFSMEYMLSADLPIYSGGLGNVAGDQLKAAGDLGVPVVAVGLLYQQGYFRQVIDKNGEQEALHPYNDPGQLPITPVRKPNGEWLRLEIALTGYSLWLRAWEVQVGRLKLYLLDSNDAANFPAHRGITSELYGGGPELRIKQEILLGIGGWRLLRALDIHPEVCHLNEGHAALAILERAASFMQEFGQPFDVALASTRPGNLFTTHTAVAAGFDRFSPDLVGRCLRNYAEHRLGITIDALLALGRRDPNDSTESFNMAYLAVRGSGAVNGVSRLHEEVSRHIFEPLFPRWPDYEVPIGHVTNGVHMPTWDSVPADDLWTQACGKDRWRGELGGLSKKIGGISDEALWQLRTTSRKSLVEFARDRMSRQMIESGASPEARERAKHLFDPDALTLGFARRFATYKRPNLPLHDRERFLRLLSDPDRPVQLIIAGKAHPEDRPGQELIHEWINFIRQHVTLPHVIFLSDYDMLLTERLVQGVDVWVNTPRRPWEACGTSGMKALVNGGLNLSELDGWWAEAYTPEVGWALGDGQEHGDDPAWDAAEADELYGLIENEVIPEFYTRNESGIPTAWVKRMRDSMAQLTPQFSASRAVREYTERHYLPAAAAYRLRSANSGEVGKQIANWQSTLEQSWPGMHFGEVKIETRGDQHLFEVEVYQNGLDSRAMRVELYADGVMGDAPVMQDMSQIREQNDGASGAIYSAAISAARPTQDYSVRVIPFFEGVAIPLEDARILWK